MSLESEVVIPYHTDLYLKSQRANEHLGIKLTVGYTSIFILPFPLTLRSVHSRSHLFFHCY